MDSMGVWPTVLALWATVAVAVYGLVRLAWPDARTRRWQALSRGAAPDLQAAGMAGWWQRLRQSGPALRLPPALRQRLRWLIDPQAETRLHTLLQQAGWTSTHAPELYRLACALGLLGLPLLLALGLAWRGLALTGTSVLAGLLLAAWAGLRLPDVLVYMRRQRRQRQIFNAFAGALDLMRVCVQAGLGLDAAMDRVGRELRWSCPPLSAEFALTGVALRAGAGRAQALRQMAARIGLPEIDALVGLLVQSDRFGTPVSQSLQVHAQMLREQRRHRAEEAAARLPVQLVIPLVFCIFPALLTVLLGPAVLGVLHNLLPSLASR